MSQADPAEWKRPTRTHDGRTESEAEVAGNVQNLQQRERIAAQELVSGGVLGDA